MGKGFTSSNQAIKKAESTKKVQLTTINEIQANLSDYFANIPDPRVSKTQKHLLLDILVIAILAVIAGAEGWEDLENYGISKQQWLEAF